MIGPPRRELSEGGASSFAIKSIVVRPCLVALPYSETQALVSRVKVINAFARPGRFKVWNRDASKLYGRHRFEQIGKQMASTNTGMQ